MSDTYEVEIPTALATQVRGEWPKLKESILSCVLQGLGPGATHTMQHDVNIFSAYSETDNIEEGEMMIEVHVSLASPEEEDMASLIHSSNEVLARKVLNIMDECVMRQSQTAGRKKRKTRKSKGKRTKHTRHQRAAARRRA